MNILLIGIFIALVLLIVLILILILELFRSKDLVSEHTLKTVGTIKDLGETIEKIIHQQEDAQKLGQSLKDLLQAPKLRGSYGEIILEEMLDKVLPNGIWQKQYSIDGRELVDAVIKFKDIIIPIDAKFPRDDYMRYIDAVSQDEKKKCWKDYEKALKTQILSISSKYIKPERGTSEFALMFIPSEAIYYETIAEKNSLGESSILYEFAQQNKVIPVSPNTFYAFLQIIIIGIRNIEVLRNAKKLQEGLVALQKYFELFFKKYKDIGKNLENAIESYRIGNDHIESYKRSLDNTLQLDGLNDKVNSFPEKVLKD